MNKNIIKLLILCFAMCVLLSSCGKEDTLPSIAGEWHLVSFEGEAPEDFDAYLVLNEDRSFSLYQKVETVFWQKFDGTYEYNGATIGGVYSDGTSWGSRYEYAYDKDSEKLTLSSVSDIPETQVYARGNIPDEIKEKAHPVMQVQIERNLQWSLIF